MKKLLTLTLLVGCAASVQARRLEVENETSTPATVTFSYHDGTKSKMFTLKRRREVEKKNVESATISIGDQNFLVTVPNDKGRETEVEIKAVKGGKFKLHLESNKKGVIVKENGGGFRSWFGW